MASRKREYLNDFKLGDDGSYRYEGTLWRWTRPGERPAHLRTAWLLVGGAAACLVAAGFVPLVGTPYPALMTLPYVVAIVGQALVAASVWRIWRGGDELRDHVYQKSVPALAAKVAITMVAGFAGGIGGVVNTVLEPAALAHALPLAALLVGCGILNSQLLHKVRELSFEKV